jgi:hypothetical protein
MGVGDTSPVSVSKNAPDTVKTEHTIVTERPELPNPAELNKLRALPVTISPGFKTDENFQHCPSLSTYGTISLTLFVVFNLF